MIPASFVLATWEALCPRYLGGEAGPEENVEPRGLTLGGLQEAAEWPQLQHQLRYAARKRGIF